MKKVQILCKQNGTSELINDDKLYEHENLAFMLKVEFPADNAVYTNIDYFLHIVLRDDHNCKIDEGDIYLGKDNVSSIPITNAYTRCRHIEIQPYVATEGKKREYWGKQYIKINSTIGNGGIIPEENIDLFYKLFQEIRADIAEAKLYAKIAKESAESASVDADSIKTAVEETTINAESASGSAVSADLSAKKAEFEADRAEAAASAHNQIQQYESYHVFPNVGSEHVLYIDKINGSSYRWDSESLKYYIVGSNYLDIKIINGGVSLWQM